MPYYPRIAGTTSKLKAFRDGRRILLTIIVQSEKLRPWRLMVVLAVVLSLFAWISQLEAAWWLAILLLVRGLLSFVLRRRWHSTDLRDMS